LDRTWAVGEKLSQHSTVKQPHALAEGEEANVSTLIKLAAFGAVLWYGGMAVYDLPMRKLEAAVFKSTAGGAG
jgi:hypothetical protein